MAGGDLGGEREPFEILGDLQRRIEALEKQLAEQAERMVSSNVRPGVSGVGTLIETATITALVANRNGIASAAFSATRDETGAAITVEVYSAPETDGINLGFGYPRFRTGDQIPIYEDSDGVFWLVGPIGETCSTT